MTRYVEEEDMRRILDEAVVRFGLEIHVPAAKTDDTPDFWAVTRDGAHKVACDLPIGWSMMTETKLAVALNGILSDAAHDILAKGSVKATKDREQSDEAREREIEVSPTVLEAGFPFLYGVMPNNIREAYKAMRRQELREAAADNQQGKFGGSQRLFQVGDVVRLRSGGPAMTVVRWANGSSETKVLGVYAAYADASGQIHEVELPPSCLEWDPPPAERRRYDLQPPREFKYGDAWASGY